MNALSKPVAGRDSSQDGRPRGLSLLNLPNEMLERIFENFGHDTIKAFRDLENGRLLAITRSCRTRHFKYFRNRNISTHELRLFMDQVVILKGIKIESLLGDSTEADSIIEALLKEREELESVEIHHSEITDKTLQLLLQHPKIKIVQLSESLVIGDIQLLPSLTSSSVIEHLNLSGCLNLVDSRIVPLLDKIGSTLRNLNLSNTEVSLSGTGALAQLPLLEELDLFGCQNIDKAGLIDFLNKTEETLKVLNLGNTGSLLKGSIESLTASLPLLEKLNLSYSGCNSIHLFAFLNKTGGALKVLDLSYTASRLISGTLTESFLLPEELDLTCCPGMDDTILFRLLNKTGGALRVLNLTDCPRVRFSGTSSLSVRFPRMEKLILTDCEHITERGLIAFLDRIGPALRILHLGGLEEVSLSRRFLMARFSLLDELIL